MEKTFFCRAPERMSLWVKMFCPNTSILCISETSVVSLDVAEQLNSLFLLCKRPPAHRNLKIIIIIITKKIYQSCNCEKTKQKCNRKICRPFVFNHGVVLPPISTPWIILSFRNPNISNNCDLFCVCVFFPQHLNQ